MRTFSSSFTVVLCLASLALVAHALTCTKAKSTTGTGAWIDTSDKDCGTATGTEKHYCTISMAKDGCATVPPGNTLPSDGTFTSTCLNGPVKAGMVASCAGTFCPDSGTVTYRKGCSMLNVTDAGTYIEGTYLTNVGTYLTGCYVCDKKECSSGQGATTDAFKALTPAEVKTKTNGFTAACDSVRVSGTAAATITHLVTAAVDLSGITAAQFDATAQTNFKTVVATYLSICGSNGATQCTASDVTIVSSARRDVAVTFTVKTTSSAKAGTGATTLNTAITTNAATFLIALMAKGGSLASVTGSTTTTSPAAITSTATTSPAAISSSSSDSSTVIIIIIIICIVVGLIIAAAAAHFFMMGTPSAEPSKTDSSVKDSSLEKSETAQPKDVSVDMPPADTLADTLADTPAGAPGGALTAAETPKRGCC